MANAREATKTENSLRNLSVSVAAYFITILFSFLGRTVFIRMLQTEYLGLNGLFSNILAMLSLTELGVGSAVAYALYAPLKAGDIPLIKAIMKLYRKLYRLIGGVILLLGVSLTPFLSWLIKDMPRDMPNIYVYYLLYVLNTGVSYFFTYKRTLIICDQREYLSTAASTASQILTVLLQMGVLLLTRNYLFYLLVGIGVTMGENALVSAKANRLYPYLREKQAEGLSKEQEEKIRKNIYAMFCHKIGTVVVNSTDNLIISSFVGLSAVGLYSNYTLLIAKAAGLLRRLFSSVTASVGMLALEEDKAHVEKVLYRLLFLSFWLYALASAAFFNLAQPFIRLWAGEAYLLPLPTVLAVAANFYLTGMRQAVLTFRDASGIFWHDRYKALAEAAANVAVSIPLAIRYGVGGVLLGTVCSTLLISFWYDGYILFKYLFRKGIGDYLWRQLIYGISALAAGAASFLLCGLIKGGGISVFLWRGIICFAAPQALFLAVFWRTEELAYYRKMCGGLGKRIFLVFRRGKW